MNGFTELEQTALVSIFQETPELESHLKHQLANAQVASRENSGAGFFTRIKVPESVPAIECPSVLGGETQARVDSLRHGFGFALFMANGRLDMLEAYTQQAESTQALDLEKLEFDIFKAPANRGR